MTHFHGLRCSSLFVLLETEETAARAWDVVAGGLGLLGATEGDSVETAAGAPRVRGIVEAAPEDGIVVRSEEPAPGLVELFAFSFKGPTHVFVRGYLYGDAGHEALAREEPVWREWLAERFHAGRKRGDSELTLRGHAAPWPPPPGVSMRRRSPRRSVPDALAGSSSPFSRLRPGAPGSPPSAPGGAWRRRSVMSE
jgi:hypothetical protein